MKARGIPPARGRKMLTPPLGSWTWPPPPPGVDRQTKWNYYLPVVLRTRAVKMSRVWKYVCYLLEVCKRLPRVQVVGENRENSYLPNTSSVNHWECSAFHSHLVGEKSPFSNCAEKMPSDEVILRTDGQEKQPVRRNIILRLNSSHLRNVIQN